MLLTLAQRARVFGQVMSKTDNFEDLGLLEKYF